GAPGEAGGLEVADRAARAVGDPADEELRVVAVERLLAPRARRRVGVGGREEEALGRQAGFLGGEPARLVEHLARDADVVADREDERGLAVVEGEAAGVELVVDLRRGRGAPSADDGLAERRGDVARRGAGAEDLPLLSGAERGQHPQEKRATDHRSAPLRTSE